MRSDPHGPVDFRAHASRPLDVFVRQHDYKPGGFTGWHTVFLQVKTGELVVYDYANPCEGITLTPGKGYVVREYERGYSDLVAAAGPLGLSECQGVLL